MPNAFWIRIVVGLAAAIYLVLAYVFDVSVEDEGLQFLGGVIFLIIVTLTAFDLFLWRLLPFAISRRPRIYGTWKAQIDSSRISPRTGQLSSKVCYLVVRQTFSAVSVTSLFDISRSKSTSADVVRDADDLVLSYTYWSAADVDKREGNPPHRGTAFLVIARNDKRFSLHGDYWTERQSRGTIRSLGHSKKHYGSYSKAEKGGYS